MSQKAVVSVRHLTIRKAPWDRNSIESSPFLKMGDEIEIEEEYCYGWNDLKYLKTVRPSGWVLESGVCYG